MRIRGGSRLGWRGSSRNLARRKSRMLLYARHKRGQKVQQWGQWESFPLNVQTRVLSHLDLNELAMLALASEAWSQLIETLVYRFAGRSCGSNRRLIAALCTRARPAQFIQLVHNMTPLVLISSSTRACLLSTPTSPVPLLANCKSWDSVVTCALRKNLRKRQ